MKNKEPTICVKCVNVIGPHNGQYVCSAHHTKSNISFVTGVDAGNQPMLCENVNTGYCKEFKSRT